MEFIFASRSSIFFTVSPTTAYPVFHLKQIDSYLLPLMHLATVKHTLPTQQYRQLLYNKIPYTYT